MPAADQELAQRHARSRQTTTPGFRRGTRGSDSDDMQMATPLSQTRSLPSRLRVSSAMEESAGEESPRPSAHSWASGGSPHNPGALSHRLSANFLVGTALELEESRSRKSRRPTGKKGGCILPVDVDDTPLEVFEPCNDMADEAMRDIGKHGFHRSARRSILLNIGVPTAVMRRALVKGDSSANIEETLDSYTKSADKDAGFCYMAVVLGVSSLQVPAALRDCGWVPGIAAILVLGALNRILAHGLIDVPHLLERRFERYADIARTCFSTPLWRMSGVMILCTWWGSCLLFLYTFIYSSPLYMAIGCEVAHDAAHPAHTSAWKIVVGSLHVVPLIPLAFMSTMRSFNRFSKWSMKLMYLLLATYVPVCVYHFYKDMNSSEHLAGHVRITYTAFQSDPDRMRKGLVDIAMAYTGLGILPYIVSEMMYPENAKQVATKAITKITMYFLAIAVVGYAGWGDAASHEVDDLELHELFPVSPTTPGNLNFYWVMSRLTSALIALKSMLTYPMFFWPLMRELEAYVGTEDSPPVALGLPWAIRERQMTRNLIRVGMVLSTLLAFLVVRNKELMQAIFAVPFTVSQMLFVPLFALIAVARYHRRQAEELEGDTFESQPVSRSQSLRSPFRYARSTSFVLASSVTLVSFCLGLYLVYVSVDRVVHQVNEIANSNESFPRDDCS